MTADVPAPETDGGSAIARLARGLAPAALTVLVAVYSMLSVCRAGSQAASEADWQDASKAVREHRIPGELVVFAPDWIDPLGRQYLGDLIDIDMAARMDAKRYPGIWEVALDGARSPDVHGLASDRTATFGPLTVRHYPQRPVDVRFDFTTQWRAAKVSGPMQGRPSLSLEEVGFEPHRCIKVIPRPDQTAVLRFESVPLGNSIIGFVGLADIFTRRDVRSPGQLSVLVNGVVQATVESGIDDGWKRFDVATSAGTADVEFRLTAPGSGALDRRICFAAEARQ